jgi:hypothetical protein
MVVRAAWCGLVSQLGQVDLVAPRRPPTAYSGPLFTRNIFARRERPELPLDRVHRKFGERLNCFLAGVTAATVLVAMIGKRDHDGLGTCRAEFRSKNPIDDCPSH